MAQRLFVCNTCGRDTLTQEHERKCPVFSRLDARYMLEQIGIPYNQDRYSLPIRLDPG